MAKIIGTESDDMLSGTAGNDSIWGLGGDDDLTASSGVDRLDGGNGDDRLVLAGVGGAVTGGAGIDTLTIDLSGRSEAITFNALNGHGIIGGEWNAPNNIYFRDIEHLELRTGSGNDYVRGGIGDDVISTGAGADRIGDGYSDEPGEAAGNDTIDAGVGDDTISDHYGANHLFGGAGNDTIDTSFTSAELDGGDGHDSLDLQDWTLTENVTIDFVEGTTSTGTVFRNFEYATVQTGWGDDTILASDLTKVHAVMNGGDDRFDGASQDDYADGGRGNDTLFGGGGNDNLYGYTGDDHLDGGADNDYVSGDVGNDVLLGGNGNDTIAGGSGDDDIEGQLGVDRLTGGDGADEFIWTEETARLNGGIDHIADFDTAGGDVISMRGFASSSTGIHDFDSFVAASHNTSLGVYVSFDGDASGILIEGITLADLSADDIVFS